MTGPLASCKSTDSKLIDDSGAAMGRLAAVRTLPDQPADCRVKEQHVRVTKGADPWSLLIREGAQLDKANSRVDRCNGTGGFYDRVQAKYGDPR
jgi:hypothetical protein